MGGNAEDAAALGEAMVASKREEMDREIDHLLIVQSENLRRYWEVKLLTLLHCHLHHINFRHTYKYMSPALCSPDIAVPGGWSQLHGMSLMPIPVYTVLQSLHPTLSCDVLEGQLKGCKVDRASPTYCMCLASKICADALTSTNHHYLALPT